jgi:hypothetical protein
MIEKETKNTEIVFRAEQSWKSEIRKKKDGH